MSCYSAIYNSFIVFDHESGSFRQASFLKPPWASITNLSYSELAARRSHHNGIPWNYVNRLYSCVPTHVKSQHGLQSSRLPNGGLHRGPFTSLHQQVPITAFLLCLTMILDANLTAWRTKPDGSGAGYNWPKNSGVSYHFHLIKTKTHTFLA